MRLGPLLVPAVALLLLPSVPLGSACGGRSELDVAAGTTGSAGTAGSGGEGCVASLETCNGADDDCDGLTDEDDPAAGLPCDTGLAAPCSVGTLRCQQGALHCAVPQGATETCNGLDDDCNGLTDDGDPGGGDLCDTGLPGACGPGVLHCVPPGVLSCVAPGPVQETCNGADDDCNGVVDDPPVCTRRVFVTSQYFLGDLGGLDGADEKCQALADAAGLGGSYRAWLSSTTVNARDRLTHLGKPYVRVDGALIAYDWNDLIDLAVPLYNPINVTEILGPPPVSNPEFDEPFVFTATLGDGTLSGGAPQYASTCGDWHSNVGDASWGLANWLTETWTNAAAGSICGDGAPLYCFEQ